VWEHSRSCPARYVSRSVWRDTGSTSSGTKRRGPNITVKNFALTNGSGEYRDLTVGGPGLAAQAIAAGLVDEYQLFVVPAVVGGGTRALPDQARLNLALAQEHRFGCGTVYRCYRPAREGGADPC
jgi:dihydrofolate reductase